MANIPETLIQLNTRIRDSPYTIEKHFDDLLKSLDKYAKASGSHRDEARNAVNDDIGKLCEIPKEEKKKLENTLKQLKHYEDSLLRQQVNLDSLLKGIRSRKKTIDGDPGDLFLYVRNERDRDNIGLRAKIVVHAAELADRLTDFSAAYGLHSKVGWEVLAPVFATLKQESEIGKLWAEDVLLNIVEKKIAELCQVIGDTRAAVSDIQKFFGSVKWVLEDVEDHLNASNLLTTQGGVKTIRSKVLDKLRAHLRYISLQQSMPSAKSKL